MRRRREARKWKQVCHDMKKAAQRVEQAAHSLSSDGSVQPGISRTGRLMLRCSTCGKVCYTDRQSARGAAAKIPDPMVVYFSERCGWWHLSTDRERGKAGATSDIG